MPNAQSALLYTIRTYERRYRRDDVPRLEVSEPYDLTAGNQQIGPWPHSDRSGVYIFLTRDWQPIYIGKASCTRRIGHRLWTYLHASLPEWLSDAVYLVTVAVPDEMRFEAPALEEYLIGELQPRSNGPGRRKPSGLAIP